MTTRRMVRRAWLREAAGTVMGSMAARAAATGGALGAAWLAATTASAESLKRPLDLVGPLIATPASGLVWPGRSTSLLTLGGVYPSPTIRVQRGDVFALRMENRLAEPTNVHWHGLAPPAAMDGYPTDLVPPGGSRDYSFQIADRGATYWYHPHADMRTGAQVYGGMAGFFIVDDGSDLGLGLPAGDRDVPLLIQDRRRRTDNSFTYAPSMMDRMAGYLGDTVLVNGTPDAELSVAAAAYRLRILNGSNARVFKIAFGDGRAFKVVAGDGGLLERPVDASSLFMAPGERAEIVVDFARDAQRATVSLVSQAFTTGGGGGMGSGMGGSSQGTPASLMRFTVNQPAEAPLVLASQFPSFGRFEPGRARVQRRFVMEMGMPPVPGSFTINGRSFEAGRVDVRVERGVLETWEIVNLSSEPHPFHIHAAQFQVTSRSSGPPAPHEQGFKDTVLVWPSETVQIAIRFDAHAGLFVLHCHNLEHEDAGMMLNLEVV